jgi:hypothetical protein
MQVVLEKYYEIVKIIIKEKRKTKKENENSVFKGKY